MLIAATLVLVVRIALWLLPSRMIVRHMTALVMPNDSHRPYSWASAPGIIWAVEAASRRIPRATCLTQAIAGQLLLRWFGYGARFCLGVARQPDGAFRAHAWLEQHGLPILGGAGVPSLSRLPDLKAEPQIPAHLGR